MADLFRVTSATKLPRLPLFGVVGAYFCCMMELEELYIDFKLELCQDREGFIQTIKRYVKYYNTQRPCFAIGYDTPENYRERYYKGELSRKNTFDGRKLTSEPKFVQKRRQLADSKDTYEDVSTFEKEIPEKS